MNTTKKMFIVGIILAISITSGCNSRNVTDVATNSDSQSIVEEVSTLQYLGDNETITEYSENSLINSNEDSCNEQSDLESFHKDSSISHPGTTSSNKDDNILQSNPISSNEDNDIWQFEPESGDADDDIWQFEPESSDEDNDIWQFEPECSDKDNDIWQSDLESSDEEKNKNSIKTIHILAYGVCKENCTVTSTDGKTFDLYGGQQISILSYEGENLVISWYNSTAIVSKNFVEVYPENHTPDFSKGKWAGVITN